MKTIKFWAIAFSLNKLLLYTVAVAIILFLISINLDSMQLFVYLWCGVMAVVFFVTLFIVRRITLTLSKDQISIKKSGKKEYTAPIEKLQYIRGANTNLPQAQGELNMIFADKIFTFCIFDMRGLSKGVNSKHIDVVKELIDTYNLQNEGQDTRNLSKLYLYRNEGYKKL